MSNEKGVCAMICNDCGYVWFSPDDGPQLCPDCWSDDVKLRMEHAERLVLSENKKDRDDENEK